MQHCFSLIAFIMRFFSIINAVVVVAIVSSIIILFLLI